MHAIAPAWPTGIACRWSPTIAIPAPVSSARVASAFAVCRSTMPGLVDDDAIAGDAARTDAARRRRGRCAGRSRPRASRVQTSAPASSLPHRHPWSASSACRLDAVAPISRPATEAAFFVGATTTSCRPCRASAHARDTEHRGLARTRRTGHRHEPVGAGDRGRGIGLALVERQVVASAPRRAIRAIVGRARPARPHA